ncbi:MAG: hypothetical protein GY805_24425 [Chloroflexi bacterium]|nr:hypothetical protein [Chloroflexota bacterium]
MVGLALIGGIGLWQLGKRRETAVFVSVIFAGLFFAWDVNPIMPFFWERYLLVGTAVSKKRPFTKQESQKAKQLIHTPHWLAHA